MSSETYFVPGYGISRQYLQTTIGFYLGPDAFIRPYCHQGRDGFLVTSPPGQRPLTQQQIDDIRSQSQAWEQQASERYAQTSDASEVYINQPVQIGQRSQTRSRRRD